MMTHGLRKFNLLLTFEADLTILGQFNTLCSFIFNGTIAYISEAMVNRSLDLGLIAKETTRVYGHKFVFTRLTFIKVLIAR